ncbi:MAG: PspA/IM30 family protein, partial [Acidimicrobiales bacterium]
AELAGQSVENRMLEVEQAQMSVEAQARLDTIREQLGIAPATGTPAVEPGAAAGSAGAEGGSPPPA